MTQKAQIFANFILLINSRITQSLKDFFAKICAFCVICVLNVSLFANQADSLQIFDIPEILITERHTSAEVRSASPLQILAGEQISRLNVLQVSDAVKHFSGVTVRDYGGIGGLKTVSVRGFGANHTAVNLDGITLSDMQTGQIDIGRFSLDNVELISLNNGQNDNIFQPARNFASASVLNIRTRRPVFEDDTRINGRAMLRAGSFGFVNPSLILNTRINRTFTNSFSAEYMQSHGRYPFDWRYGTGANDSIARLTRENTDVRNLRLETTFFGNLSARESARLKLYFFNSERGLPGSIIDFNEMQNAQQRVWDRTFFTQAHYRRELSELWHFQTNAKYNYSWMRYVDAGNLGGEIENIYAQQEFYLSASVLFRAFENFSFSFSSDGFVNTMESNLRNFAYPTRYTLLSVLAAKYETNRILATASILNTLVTESVRFGDLPDNHNHFSPYLGFSVRPFQEHNLRFRAFYKNIFRLPTFNDLYFTDIGNTNLRPETTQQFNIGTSYLANIGQFVPQISFSADAYHNQVKDKIVALPSRKDIFLWSMLNFGEVSITGIDLNAEINLQPSNGVGVLLGISHSYKRALNVTDPNDQFTYRHQIPYTPRVSGAVRAGVETRWLNVFYSLVWSGHRYALLQNYTANRVEGFQNHSISLQRSFDLSFGQLAANAEFLNLSNINYEIIRGFPMPGRSVRVSVGLRF